MYNIFVHITSFENIINSAWGRDVFDNVCTWMYLLDIEIWIFAILIFVPIYHPLGYQFVQTKNKNKTKQNKKQKQKHQTKTKTKKHICAHQIDTQFKYIGCLHLQLKLPDHYIYEELVSKISYIHPDMLLILYYWLPFAIKIVQVSQDMFLCGLLSFDLCKMFTKWLKVGMSDMQE